ncbi:MAG: YceI family protein [Chlorobiaceae bacterium]|jgi:polyisoprenoid-binding protein YceI|nr:YceI family protein [Chlorobiaceae bacterium]
MKYHARIFIFGLLLLMPLSASAAAWNIDADHSSIGFSIRHLMVSNVRGNFDRFSGTVDLDDRNIIASKVTVTIDPASINTRLPKRDEHLRGPEFFDVTKYPSMSFVSKQWRRDAKGKLKVTADLTMHGVTRTVVLDVAPFSPETADPWGNFRRGTTAKTTINRKDFGLDWSKTMDNGGLMIGEEVEITMEIEMVKAKAN